MQGWNEVFGDRPGLDPESALGRLVRTGQYTCLGLNYKERKDLRNRLREELFQHYTDVVTNDGSFILVEDFDEEPGCEIHDQVISRMVEEATRYAHLLDLRPNLNKLGPALRLIFVDVLNEPRLTLDNFKADILKAWDQICANPDLNYSRDNLRPYFEDLLLMAYGYKAFQNMLRENSVVEVTAGPEIYGMGLDLVIVTRHDSSGDEYTYSLRFLRGDSYSAVPPKPFNSVPWHLQVPRPSRDPVTETPIDTTNLKLISIDPDRFLR